MCETAFFCSVWVVVHTAHCTLTAPNIIHYFRQKICNDVFESIRSVCNSSRCSFKIAGRLSCKKSVNICANSVTVQSLRNFDSLNFSLFFCLCFSLPPVNSLQVVESKIKNLKNDQISLSLGGEWGSTAVGNLSENSSNLEAWPIPAKSFAKFQNLQHKFLD